MYIVQLYLWDWKQLAIPMHDWGSSLVRNGRWQDWWLCMKHLHRHLILRYLLSWLDVYLRSLPSILNLQGSHLKSMGWLNWILVEAILKIYQNFKPIQLCKCKHTIWSWQIISTATTATATSPRCWTPYTNISATAETLLIACSVLMYHILLILG